MSTNTTLESIKAICEKPSISAAEKAVIIDYLQRVGSDEQTAKILAADDVKAEALCASIVETMKGVNAPSLQWNEKCKLLGVKTRSELEQLFFDAAAESRYKAEAARGYPKTGEEEYMFHLSRLLDGGMDPDGRAPLHYSELIRVVPSAVLCDAITVLTTTDHEWF